MMTFIYDDLKEMYTDSKNGNAQFQILIYLHNAEDLMETKIEENNLYEHFDVEFNDFDLDYKEINDPESIINSFLEKQALKKEAALYLHEMIGLVYKKYKKLSSCEKEKLKIYTMIDMLGGDYREEALKSVYEYSKKELEKINQLV